MPTTLHIHCALVGDINSGKSTTINAITAQPLSTTSRDHDTQRARIYREAKDGLNVDDAQTIAQRNAEADAITKGDPTALTPIEHGILPHALSITELPVDLIDMPGSNCAQSKEHWEFLRDQLKMIQVFGMVVDINHAFHETGRQSYHIILQNIIELVNMAADEEKCLIVIVNKCDDMSLDANGNLTFDDPELAKMYTQIQDDVVQQCEGVKNLHFRVCPISAVDAYVYRMMHFHSNAQIDMKHIQHIGMQELGKRKWQSMSETDQRAWFKEGLQTSDYKQRMAQCGFQQMTDSFRALVELQKLQRWITQFVADQVAMYNSAADIIFNDDYRALHDIIRRLNDRYIRPLFLLKSWLLCLLENHDGLRTIFLESSYLELSPYNLPRSVDDAFHRHGSVDLSDYYCGEKANGYDDLHKTITYLKELILQYGECECFTEELNVLLMGCVNDLIQHYTNDLTDYIKDVDYYVDEHKEFMHIARKLHDFCTPNADVLSPPLRTIIEAYGNKTAFQRYSPHYLVNIWNQLADMGVDKNLITSWAKAHLLHKNTYAPDYDVPGQATYHLDLEVRLGHLNRTKDPVLFDYLSILEARTKQLNYKHAGSLTTEPGETSVLTEFEWFMGFYQTMQKESKKNVAPRRSHRRRKRAMDEDTPDDEEPSSSRPKHS